MAAVTNALQVSAVINACQACGADLSWHPIGLHDGQIGSGSILNGTLHGQCLIWRNRAFDVQLFLQG